MSILGGILGRLWNEDRKRVKCMYIEKVECSKGELWKNQFSKLCMQRTPSL
jgi:hypothetical protein